MEIAKLNYADIAVAAIKEEARLKPDVKLMTIDGTILTYSQISDRIDDKLVQKLVVQPYIKMLKEVPEFRNKILRMLNLEE